MSTQLPGCPSNPDAPITDAADGDIASVNSLLLNSAEKYGAFLREDVGPDVSPYVGFFDRTMWPDGQSHFNRFNWESNAPDQELEGRWASVRTSDGVYNACQVAFDEIPYGWTKKQGCQYRTAFRTPWFCLEDLRYKHDRANQVAGILRIMSRWFSVIQMNFISLMYKRFTDNYIPVDATASGKARYAIQHGEFASGAYPVSGLTPGMLRMFYLDKGYKNAHKLSVGSIGGGLPMHSMMIGDQLWRDIIEVDPKFRAAILEFEPQRITNGMSVKQSIEGFTPLFVQYPHRFDINRTTGELDLIQPLINVPTTSGIKSEVNPAWELAPFEWVALPTRDSVTFTDPPTGTSVGQANFDATPFRATPNVKWHNVRDNDTNVLGNQGFFYTLIQMGALPNFTDHGHGVLVRRPNIRDVITCGDFVQYDAADSLEEVPTVYVVTDVQGGLDATKKVIELNAAIDGVSVDATKLLLAYHTGDTVVVTVTGASDAEAPFRYEVTVDDDWPCDCSAVKSATVYEAPAEGPFTMPDDPQAPCECVDPCASY